MMPNNDEMTKEVLQTHCDQIIAQLETAVQAAVYAKRFKSGNVSDRQKATEAAKQTKNDYVQTVRSLYSPKDLPLIYTEVYNSAISENPTESYRGHGSSDEINYHFKEIYTIKAGQIIRQLNDDFLPKQPRSSWVSYNKPHLNFVGEITHKRVGAPDYKMCWLDGSQEALEEKTIYLDLMKDGLFYTVLDPDDHVKTGKISLNKVLSLTLQEGEFHNPIGTGVYQPIDAIKHADGLTYRVLSPSADIQTGKLSFDNILALVKFDHLERPDDNIYVEISEVKESPSYCYSFIMHILSHPIAQIVAIALLVVGATLALSGIAVGVGAGMAVVGAGILIAGFFAPKRTPEKETLTPDFFTPRKSDQVSNGNNMLVSV